MEFPIKFFGIVEIIFIIAAIVDGLFSVIRVEGK
jgi:hypothetical protein